MVDDMLRYTLRVNRRLFRKFRFVAEFEGRSLNKELSHYIKLAVRKFEEEHGVIKLSDQEEE